MKIVFEKAQEVLEAFEQLPQQEKEQFWVALQAIMPKHITPRDTSLNPLDFFGMAKGQQIDADALRKEAWNGRM